MLPQIAPEIRIENSGKPAVSEPGCADSACVNGGSVLAKKDLPLSGLQSLAEIDILEPGRMKLWIESFQILPGPFSDQPKGRRRLLESEPPMAFSGTRVRMQF